MRSIRHFAWALVACLLTMSAAQAQYTYNNWNFEIVEANEGSRAGNSIARAGDGTIAVLFSGPTDGFSCDGTADVRIKIRTAPNNWIEIPTGLRVTRPVIAMDGPGNIYVAFEYMWAYYTGIQKYIRTGPTTWVKDGNLALIKSPGLTPCGQTDNNLPSNTWMYGYNPRICVAPNGSIGVTANGSGNLKFAYNSGADWRTGWNIALTRANASASWMMPDPSSNIHLIGIQGDGSDPNSNDLLYTKFTNGVPSVGPFTIADGGARTGDAPWLALNGSTAVISAMNWNYGGNGVWQTYRYDVTGTTVTGPTLLIPATTGLNEVQIFARDGWIRWIWRTDATDARWAWYLGRPGYPNERFTLPGHDPNGARMIMDEGGNLHLAFLDYDPAYAQPHRYTYGYRVNDEPPVGGPKGTLAGVVRDQFGNPVSNATVQVGGAGITAANTIGVYSLQVGVGTYTATASKGFYAQQSVPGIVIVQNQTTTQDFTITGQPPAAVTNLQVIAGNTSNALTWSNPGSGNFSGTMVRFKTTGYPTSPADGTPLLDSTASSFSHTGLTNGTTCYYTAFSHYNDSSIFYAGGATAQGRPNGPADFDNDGDVDQSDFAQFQLCLSGQSNPQARPACSKALLDADNDVDGADFAIFLNCISGADALASPTCAN